MACRSTSDSRSALVNASRNTPRRPTNVAPARRFRQHAVVAGKPSSTMPVRRWSWCARRLGERGHRLSLLRDLRRRAVVVSCARKAEIEMRRRGCAAGREIGGTFAWSALDEVLRAFARMSRWGGGRACEALGGSRQANESRERAPERAPTTGGSHRISIGERAPTTGGSLWGEEAVTRHVAEVHERT